MKVPTRGRTGRVFLAAALAGLAALTAAGCASGPKPSSELAAKFAPAMEIGPDESLVYVIRQKTMMGAALPLYVGFDDKIVADLGAGTFASFKVPKGIHTFSLEQPNAFSWLPVDLRASETIFLYYQYDRNLFSEIDSELGKTLAMQLKPCKAMTEDFDSSALADSLINPSLVGLTLMKEGGPEAKAGAESAVVTFYRTKELSTDKGIAIWCDGEFLGNLPAKRAFSAELSAGRHLFYSGARWTDDDMVAWLKDVTKSSGKNAWVTAELEAGREYYVNLEAGVGKFGLAVVLAASNADGATKSKVAALKPLTLDEGAITETVRARLEAAAPEIAKVMSEDKVKLLFAKGVELKPEDGSPAE
jgi:hypothetical protein